MTVATTKLDRAHSTRTVPDEGRRPISKVWMPFLPAAAVLLMFGEVLTPKGLDKPSTTVAAAMKALSIGAAHSTQVYASNLLVIFGLGALGVSFAAIATLLPNRAATFGTAAALIGGFAAFCGALANMLVGFNVAAAATAHTAPIAAAPVLVSADTSAVSTMLVVAYLGGGLIATILIGATLWHSEAVPRWLAVLFSLGLVVAAASRPGIVAIPMQLPFAVAMFLLAVRLRAQG